VSKPLPFVSVAAPEPDKTLGQHFLSNPGVVQRIVDWVGILATTQSKILEVGPGPGVLTDGLLQKFPALTVLEIDPRMKAYLELRFAEPLNGGTFHIVHEDALKVSRLEQLGFSSTDSIVCVGNLPYNVGTKIIFSFLETFPQMTSYCVMLQKEVIDRLKAKVGDDSYGIPSVKFALLCDGLESFLVSPGSFRPPPKVDSAVLRFRRRNNFNSAELKLMQDPALYARFFAHVSRAFSKRRKMIKATFAKLKANPIGQRRPEELTLADWLDLFFAGELDG